MEASVQLRILATKPKRRTSSPGVDMTDTGLAITKTFCFVSFLRAVLA